MSDTANYNWPKPRTPGASQIVEIQRVATALDQADAKAKEITDALAALNAAYDAHTHAFGDLTGKPSTVAGFGITDVYTKSQINTKVANDIDAAVNALINGSPGALDTLQELATAMGNDPNFAATVTNSLAKKVTKSLNLSDIPNKAAALANLGGLANTGGTLNGQLVIIDDAGQSLILRPKNGAQNSFLRIQEESGAAYGLIGAFNGDLVLRRNSKGTVQIHAGDSSGTVSITGDTYINGDAVWHAGNFTPSSKLNANAKAVDSAKLNGSTESTGDTADTIAKRNSSGDLVARMFRSNYAVSGSLPGDGEFIMRGSASDPYMRPITGEAANSALPGTAKAWVNFNGTGSVAIRDSFNVSSITDNGTGDYSINFATPMANSNYACVATYGQSAISNAGVVFENTDRVRGLTRMSVASKTITESGTETIFPLTDRDYISVAIFGD